MLIRQVPLIGLITWVLFSSTEVQVQQPPLFRSGTELVDLYITVTDEEGRLVPNLSI